MYRNVVRIAPKCLDITNYIYDSSIWVIQGYDVVYNMVSFETVCPGVKRAFFFKCKNFDKNQDFREKKVCNFWNLNPMLMKFYEPM